MQRVQRARLTYAGVGIAAVAQFKYLGVVFHCTRPLAETASEGRAAVARFAAAMFEGRCAELGLEASRLLLMLYDQMVDSTLSYAAATWAPGLAAAAAQRGITGGSCSAPEQQQIASLRRLLGLPRRTPTATVLAEAGQAPLYVSWLMQAARLWSTLVATPPGSIMHQVLDASLQLAAECEDEQLALAGRKAGRQAHLPWATQLQQAMTAAGVDFDPQQREPLQPAEVRRTALSHHLQQVAQAAGRSGASQLHHYFVVVRPSCLDPDKYSMPAYLTEVRERRHRIALAELRTGVHWGAEATARLLGATRPPREQRVCPHCAAAGSPNRVEDVPHILFECTLYRDMRTLFPDLFPAEQPPQEAPPSLETFLGGPPAPLAKYAQGCRRLARQRQGLPP